MGADFRHAEGSRREPREDPSHLGDAPSLAKNSGRTAEDEPAARDADPPPLVEPGRVLFGKYKLIEKIGTGGMGEVWRVWHVHLETERALKLIKPEIAQEDPRWRRLERAAQERFGSVARFMTRINHPNVVVIHDVRRTQGMAYVEMELVRGRCLRDILEERNGRPMPVAWIVEFLEQLCSVLEAAHAHGIVHHAIEPSKLMLVNLGDPSHPPQLKVLDFGIAMMGEGEDGLELTATGDTVGTPVYMSPEQIGGGFDRDGRPHEVDGRADLYSTGVVLYQLLTGTLPFRGKPMAVLAAHLNNPPLPMKEANARAVVSPAVERVVMQCLEKDPSRRPQSARELAERFRQASQPPPASRRPSLLRRVLDAFQKSEAPGPSGLPATPEPVPGSETGPVPTGPEHRSMGVARSRSGRPEPGPAGVGRKLYVGNLDPGLSRSDLKAMFSPFGSVESAEIILDRATGQSRGFGFVAMSTEAEAAAAVEALDGQEHAGRRLTVGQARAREPRSLGGGYRGGGSGGGRPGGRGGGGGSRYAEPPSAQPGAPEPSPEPSEPEVSLLDQIISASRPEGDSGTRHRLKELADEVLKANPSLDRDVLTKINAAIQDIDAKLGATDSPAAVRELTSVRVRLQDLVARVEGSDRIEDLLDKLVTESAATARFRAETEATGRLQHPELMQPPTIRRHTDVSFPATVQTGKVYNLRVQLVPAEETLPSGAVRERPRPHEHDATVDLTVPPPPRPGTPPPPIHLMISVAAENFEIEGPGRAELIVPLAGKSPAVAFGLRGLDIGPGRIMVDFAQDGRPVGSVDLTTQVIADLVYLRPSSGLAPTLSELSLSLDLDLGLGGAPAPPDVVLKVFEHRLAGHPGRLQFVLSSSHPALADLPVLDGDLGTLDLRADLAGWVDEQLRAVGALAGQDEATAGDVARTLADVGFNLYQHLLPRAVQELSWTLRNRGIKTLMILSDDPHIPWELIKPFRADPLTAAITSEDDFWGESYALAHWLRGRPPVPRLSVTRVLGVAAGSGGALAGAMGRSGSASADSSTASTRDMVRIDASSARVDSPVDLGASGSLELGLATADEELALLCGLEALGARVERLPALRRSLREAFEQGTFDLLHLVSHGTFGGQTAGDASAVFLDDGAFTAAELSPRMAAALRRTAPLVIFNTCHCGRMGFSLTCLGSWGAHLVQLGCGGFVGALWPVSDRAALAFARAFYQQLAQRCPLGEAVRLARLRVHEQYPDDPTWLAYRCFADPMARVDPGEASHSG